MWKSGIHTAVIARSGESVEGDAAIPGSLHHAMGVIRDDKPVGKFIPSEIR